MISLLEHEELLRKTNLYLARHGTTKNKALPPAETKSLQDRRAALSVELDLNEMTDPLKLWDIKTELFQNSPDFVQGIFEKYPELQIRLEQVTFAQIKALSPAKKWSPSLVRYPPFITSRTTDKKGEENLGLQEMTLDEAMVRLKAHRDALFLDWRTSQDKFFLTEQSMRELNWRPDPSLSKIDQFNEYKRIFITPVRRRRETGLWKWYWDARWEGKMYSVLKRRCSTRLWRVRKKPRKYHRVVPMMFDDNSPDLSWIFSG